MVPASFFPEGIHFFFTDRVMSTEVLTERELALTGKYGPKRLGDFCTGRYCARSCTSALGYGGDILTGERGMPLLPDHITASISHSKGLSGAIAGLKSQFSSVGMDIERSGRIKRDMWRLLFTAEETKYLLQLNEAEQALTTTIFFSLKEAFYKMQYPLTATYLDFHDASIRVDKGTYLLSPTKWVNKQLHEGTVLQGQVYVGNEDVISYFVQKAEKK